MGPRVKVSSEIEWQCTCGKWISGAWTSHYHQPELGLQDYIAMRASCKDNNPSLEAIENSAQGEKVMRTRNMPTRPVQHV